jgi:hypothetical protein
MSLGPCAGSDGWGDHETVSKPDSNLTMIRLGTLMGVGPRVG